MEVGNTEKVIQGFISTRSREVTSLILKEFLNLSADSKPEEKIKVIYSNIVQTYYEGYYLAEKLYKKDR